MNAAAFTIGQPFNPYRRFHGIYIPEPICKYRGLSPGAKLVFGRLARFAGSNGKTYPSITRLGAELGTSAKQVRRYVRELEDKGFIRPSRTAGRSNEYEFLWHAAFEGDPGKTRKRRGTTPVNGSIDTPVNGSTTTPVNGTPVNGRQRESVVLRESCKENQSSSGSAEVKPTDDDTLFSQNPKPEDLEALVSTARDRLRAARAEGAGVSLEQVACPDRAITVQILEAFSDYADFTTWLEGTVNRGVARKAKSATWGLYLADAKNQAEDLRLKREAEEKRVRDWQIEQERQRAAEEEKRRALDTPMSVLDAFGYIQGRMVTLPWALKARLVRTGELVSPNALEAEARAWRRCPECGDSGVVGSSIDRSLAFCACSAAVEARYRDGDDWPEQEVGRVHADAGALLTAAANECGCVFLGDAFKFAKVQDDGAALEIQPANEVDYFMLTHDGSALKEILQRVGWARALRVIGPAAHVQ